MVGQGVLRECLLDPDVTDVLVVGRSSTGVEDRKLHEVVHADLMQLAPIEAELAGHDSAFFCLGASAAGMSEERYRRITYDITMAVAESLAALNPQITFIYVSGQGTDSTERGRTMWARVKGETENALLRLPFKGYMFRPGFIQPMHGASSKTRLYSWLYRLSGPIFPMLRLLAPRSVTTTETVGRAMIRVARSGWPSRVLETRDINAAGDLPSQPREP
jgi:uncharacterized protein YbjT (DUF2867 family)